MNMLTNSLTRLLRTGLCLGLTSFSVSLAQAQNVITWTGNVDAFYTKPGNWDLGRVPNWMDDVRIPIRPNQPVLDATLGIGTAGTLTINAGATLTLNPQSELDLFANLLNNGSFVGMGLLSVRSPVPVGGTVPTLTTHTISGTGNAIVISDLELAANAPTSLLLPVRLMRQLSLTSSLTTTSAGTLTLMSTPTVTAFVVNNGAAIVDGTVTVQRAIDVTRAGMPSFAGAGYRHYSSPVSNTNVADFITSGFTPTLTQSYNESTFPPATVPFPTVYNYDQALVNRTNGSPNFDKGWRVPSSLAEPLVPGRGYTVNIAGDQLVDFVGTLNNAPNTVNPAATIAVPFARNAANTMNANDAGWVFLGNPFPSPMDYSLVVASDRAGLDNAIYVYISTGQYTGFYRAYTLSTGTTPGSGNPVIPVGQAFFAHVTTPGTSGTFNFRNTQRVTTSDGTTFQRTAADGRPQLELALQSSDKVVQDMLNVIFQDVATPGVDPLYDAVKPLNNNGMMLNTVAADGQALAIDSRPLPTDQLTIPLRLQVATSGTYTLNTSKLANMGGMHVYLRDLKQGSLTDLGQQPTYSVALNAANNSARFELVFSKQPVETIAPATLTNQVSVYPSPAKGKAFVELPTSLGGEAVTATLVDALGRTVRTASLPAKDGATHEVSLEGLRGGIYVLRLHTSAGIVAKRLVIE